MGLGLGLGLGLGVGLGLGLGLGVGLSKMVATQASALSTRQLKPSGGGLLDRYIDFRANVASKGLPSLGLSSHRRAAPANPNPNPNPNPEP